MAILVTCDACHMTMRLPDAYLDKKAWCPHCKAPITLTGERVPNHAVFISYSKNDKVVADAICATLEQKEIRCWIAPRDISAGQSWGGTIIEAIEDAQVMVLVYSASSNFSKQVIREVERAVAKGLVLVPFRIEGSPMSKDMEYFLSASHWLDALSPPLEHHLAKLAEMVRQILFRKEKEKELLAPQSKSDQVFAMRPTARKTLPWRAVAGVLIGALLAVIVLLGLRHYQQPRNTVSPASFTVTETDTSEIRLPVPNAPIHVPLVTPSQSVVSLNAVMTKPTSALSPSQTHRPPSKAELPRPAHVQSPTTGVTTNTFWVNSLGMRFVPVAGASVQFSIWDTRVQDYQAFITATGRSWQKPSFEQGPTHPAVNISWGDAKAFCAWLTTKERHAGILKSTQEYRLPMAAEWSAAVGLKGETDCSPKDRGKQNKTAYPWGTQWPPPRGAGNYAASLNVDDFAQTSPVGNFAANQFGLYDMGGNVWQWCEDIRGQPGTHVLRGGSWSADRAGSAQGHLKSSYHAWSPSYRDSLGFRCVLANTIR